MRHLIIAAALLMAACAPSNTTPPDGATPPADGAGPQTAAEATAQDTCGASGYRSLVGSSLAAVTLPADANIRIIQPDTMVTQDFRPDRINMIVDADGTITGLECY